MKTKNTTVLKLSKAEIETAIKEFAEKIIAVTIPDDAVVNMIIDETWEEPEIKCAKISFTDSWRPL